MRAAERRCPGGLSGALDRLHHATNGAVLTLTAAQLEVLTLLACGVETVRDLCTARGISVRSTNAIAEHTAALEKRRLVERVRPRDGAAYRYAPWVLTSLGWVTLGPCACVLRAVQLDVLVERDGRYRMARHQLGTMASAAAMTEAGAAEADRMRPIAFCPWCGWRLW